MDVPKTKRVIVLLLANLMVFVGVLAFRSDGWTSNSTSVPALTNAQCVLCHPKEPATIDARGGKHKSAVGCLDCHKEHPPVGTKAIPKCSECHSGKAHYEEAGNCTSCHVDVHAPLDLKIGSDVTGPCLTCHKKEGDQLKVYPSAHTDLACTECHPAHKEIPSCLKCHEKHTEDMNLADCKSCHPAHMPLIVTYSKDTPSHYCASCHQEAYDTLQKNKTKHHDLSCVFCHKNKHKTVPPCFACHGKPHPDAILKKYSDCSGCHNTAHDLK